MLRIKEEVLQADGFIPVVLKAKRGFGNRYWMKKDSDIAFMQLGFPDGRYDEFIIVDTPAQDDPILDYSWSRHTLGSGYTQPNQIIWLYKHIMQRPLGKDNQGGLCVDHIDRFRWNNTRKNLRVVTPAENASNRGKRDAAMPIFITEVYQLHALINFVLIGGTADDLISDFEMYKTGVEFDEQYWKEHSLDIA